MENRVEIEIVQFWPNVLCKVRYFGIMIGGMAGVNDDKGGPGGIMDSLAKMDQKCPFFVSTSKWYSQARSTPIWMLCPFFI